MFRHEAKDYNTYLQDEGVPPILDLRRQKGELDRPARERYSKHVKTVFQVGDAISADWQTAFGYPAELVPLDNPYARKVGETLRVRCLVDGEVVPGLVVIAGGRTPAGERHAVQTVRADAEGIATISLASSGTWYVKFIHMVPVAEPDVDYESKWATLTFAVR